MTDEFSQEKYLAKFNWGNSFLLQTQTTAKLPDPSEADRKTLQTPQINFGTVQLQSDTKTNSV